MKLYYNDIIKESSAADFEQLYIDVRRREKRIYSDEEVLQLPHISKRHLHYKEWKFRKESSERLINYLKHRKRALHILEIGCGNGWLASKMALLGNSVVTGLDINQPEIRQARRVFADRTNLDFIYGSINDVSYRKFDVIVFAASFQYFSKRDQIIEKCFQLLKSKGEIHITDTHFYKDLQLLEARERTNDYYCKLGYERMKAFYFHHSLEEFSFYNCNILYNPFSIQNRIRFNKNPFYWVRLQHK
ncbi:MAG TPA: methyltransferase domain-containing protein [Flavisolibacter sp.]|nr:methyltransferase domain-containing protein [Flavisolibacter sp.]